MARIGYFILDWGLGHATRSAPIIQYLIDQGHDLFLFSSGSAKSWLDQAFTELICREIPGYDVAYNSSSANRDIMRQTPGIIKKIEVEHSLTKQLTSELDLDLIISDNRYGCFHPDISSVIITHQIQPPSAFFLQGLTNSLVKKNLQNFDVVWIPDSASPQRLSGKLSHGHEAFQHRFLGPLSRLEGSKGDSATGYDICVVISGPENARTKFESKMTGLLQAISGNHLLIAGQPHEAFHRNTKNVEFVSHLADDELASALLNSRYIICRSGYSSIMDLVALGLRANVIPTPGQKEQEYLAKHMSDTMGWVSLNQNETITISDLIEAKDHNPLPIQEDFREVIDAFILGIA